MSNFRTFTPREIEGRIAAGDSLVIFRGHVLSLNRWQDVHPGGRLVIQHMVGRDASDELSISHSLETLESMKRFRIGNIDGEWKNFIPPIQGGVFRRTIKTDQEPETSVTSDDTPNAAGISERSPALKPTSVVLQPEIIATEQMAVCSEKSGEKTVPEPQAFMGWKVEPEANSYAATAIQDAIDADIAKYPSLDAATQRNIAIKFRALHQRVHDEGYYQCRFSEYAKETGRCLALFCVFLTFLHYGWYVSAGIALGIFWQQIMFTAHDAGHCGITHNYVVDSLIGIFIGNFVCGLSIGWWKSSHNVHHFVTNDPVHDPDTQNIPMFTISPGVFHLCQIQLLRWLPIHLELGRRFLRPIPEMDLLSDYGCGALQSILPILGCIWASARSVKRGTAAWIRPTEVLAILCYIYLFFYLCLWKSIPNSKDAFVLLLVSHMATLPLQIQITLSHWGASTSDLGPGEAFAQRQLRTTVDVACPEWLDFFHGGLQFQAVHHLFPRVPRHNLRKLSVLVRKFCEETGIDYQILGFVEGNHSVLGKLQHLTDQAKILAACQQHMAATESITLPKLPVV